MGKDVEPLSSKREQPARTVNDAGADPSLLGGGGHVHRDSGGPTFSVDTSVGSFLLRGDGSGYRMEAPNGANFYFNPGECQVFN